jgi:hypothetical protein
VQRVAQSRRTNSARWLGAAPAGSPCHKRRENGDDGASVKTERGDETEPILAALGRLEGELADLKEHVGDLYG